MQTRKIQMVGGSTYTVSLPKEWAESEGIATGDTVNLHTHIDDVLVIQAGVCEDESPWQVVVEVSCKDTKYLERTLRAAYAVGAEEVILKATEQFTPAQRRTVQRIARNLTGVSVVKESDTKITVRTLLETAEVSVRQSVRQLKFVALSMHRDATAALAGDVDPESVLDRDDQADRLYAMIDRSFSRTLARLDEVDALGITRPEAFELWKTTRALERIADHAEDIAIIANEADSVIGPIDNVEELAQTARVIVADAVSVIVGDSGVETAQRALMTRDRLRERISGFETRTAESTGSLQCRLVLDRIRQTADHGGTIAERGIENAIRHGDPGVSNSGEKDDRDREPNVSAGG